MFAWAETAEGSLALLILLDQFPRNLYRGSAHAFATDPKARAIARAAIERGFDREVEPAMRNFFHLQSVWVRCLVVVEGLYSISGDVAPLAAIASTYTYSLWNATPSNFGLIAGAVIWIVLMTWICYRGIELSARIQQFLLTLEIVTLVLFVVVALVKVYSNNPLHSIHISGSWFNPFDLGWGSLIDGVLLGIFIYWGWDSGVAVNEESRDRHRGPGKAAVVSTFSSM